MTKLMLAAVALLCAAAPAAAQTTSSDELNRRSIARRAVEAAIWGMPIVNYDLMLREMLGKTDGKINQVIYWGRPLDWRNQTLTPNPDTLYFMAFFNTKDVGPVVLETPPADSGGSLNANIVNIWQAPLEDAGLLGVDRGAGAKFVILPPNHTEKVPDGYVALKPGTYGSYALIRSNLKSHSDADVAASVAYGKRVRVYPLSQAANPPATTFTDVKDVTFDSTIRYDASFFEGLNRVVQSEPWLDRDRAMIDQLRSIGIEKGMRFNPNPQTRAQLEQGIREAQAWFEAKYDAGLPPFWDRSRWTLPALPELLKGAQTEFNEPDAYPVDARGLTYTYGYIGIKRLGAGQFYLISIRDKDGDTLDGGQTYRLTVPANAPIEQYWSVTAYDRQTHALIKNMARASRSSQIPEMQKNTDGSIDVYFGPRAPAGKEANWVPTDPARKFELMFRLYGPKKEFFDKAWKLSDVEKLTETTGARQ
jgi:hypothetical protein